MKKPVIHKWAFPNEVDTECHLMVYDYLFEEVKDSSKASDSWKPVTCKECLKKKPKRKIK